jgi:hypothetical protein
MAKQLCFDQAIWNGTAIDGDEGTGAPRASGPDGARRQLLARPGLPLDQHRGVAPRDLLDLAHQRADPFRGANGQRDRDRRASLIVLGGAPA